MTDKSLRDMGVVLEGTGRPHGDEVVTRLLERCHQSEALSVIDELTEHVRKMGIASRFRADRYAGQMFEDRGETPPSGLIDLVYGGGEKLSEKGHKRSCLLIELQAIRERLSDTFSQLARLRLDIEATNMEVDGSHVPQPTEEELRRTDNYQKLQS